MPITRRPLIVGESNPYPCAALAPDFPNSSGARLLRMINEVATMHPSEYEHAFDRRNLCRRRWNDKVAERAGEVLKKELRINDRVILLGRSVVLLGHKVRRAVGVPPLDPFGVLFLNGITYYCIPHPSGLNRLYNNPALRRHVGQLLLRLARG